MTLFHLSDLACADPATVPPSLQDYFQSVVERLDNHFTDEQKSKLLRLLDANPSLLQQCCRALMGSQYVVDSVISNPDLLVNWLLIDTPYAPLSDDRIVEMVELFCCECPSQEALAKQLRQLRRRLMVVIIWRDLNRLSDFAEVCQSMTVMAEACIQQALDFHYKKLIEKYGLPMGKESAQPQLFLVLGMGKLGGAELNVSSDIDLMFVFPEAGETNHASRPIENQQFFTRLGQQLIKTLNDITAEGFVFRVDMRLRPYGQSGALVSSFAALENYYETQGRDWERFAAVKARVVAYTVLPEDSVPDSECLSLALYHQAESQLHAILRPFVYRRYIDFSVIDSLRKLKAMIVQEVRRKGVEANIKLGAGGIRELEFMVQAVQLVRGGRDLYFQQRHWLTALERMQKENVLDAKTCEVLKQAYIFLRNVEHAIQSWKDEQTQQLPSDKVAQNVLAWMFNSENWEVFLGKLNRYREIVHQQFQAVIAQPEDASEFSVEFSVMANDLNALWLNAAPEKQAEFEKDAFIILKKNNIVKIELVWHQLQSLHQCWAVKQLSARSREALDKLVPQILSVAIASEQPALAAVRLLQWLEKVVGRSSYMTLLLENPAVLQRLSLLFQGSVWIVELLGQMPALLDELIDANNLYCLPSKAELQDELRQRLLRVDLTDAEAVMEVLRYFKLAHQLRVAACDLSGKLPLMKVSDYLTWIAEVVLEQVLSLAWSALTQKHGVPDGVYSGNGLSPAVPGFAIIGYGKLGGIELSYRSDLDLVFIYEASPHGTTNGDKPLENQTFYTRLGQKIIHFLNTRMVSGSLYEVDMRLRPSGNAGLLVSSLAAFERYQEKDAWIWEHQALVRARALTGDTGLMTKFAQLRLQILRRHREIPALKAAVINMRQKMRDHLGSTARSTVRSARRAGIDEKSPLFHLKQDAGGIVDIEFMVQYTVLALADQYPDFAEYTDNIRLLEYLQSACETYIEQSGACLGFTRKQAASLIEIYQAYREVSHRLALQKQTSLLSQEQITQVFAAYALPEKCQQVSALWQQLFADELNQ